LRGIVFIAAVMLNFVEAVFAAEKDYDSANAMMPVCRDAVKTESRPQESEQDDKWSFCLTAGTLCPANQERQ
jgi:hypothetical protein